MKSNCMKVESKTLYDPKFQLSMPSTTSTTTTKTSPSKVDLTFDIIFFPIHSFIHLFIQTVHSQMVCGGGGGYIYGHGIHTQIDNKI